MRKVVGIAALALLAPPALAQQSIQYDPQEGRQARTISWGGTEVTLQPRSTDEEVELSLAVRVPGIQTIITDDGLEGGSHYPRRIQIVRLNATDPFPSVLVQGYTGGAHCCSTMRIITPSAGRLRVVDLESNDGEPNETLPRDIDGDGSLEIERQDDSFRYQFASGAGSWSPPAIFNVYKGQAINVSDQPVFRPVWEGYAAEALRACSDRTDADRNGACAAYAAAGARLGRGREYFDRAVMLAAEPNDFNLPTDCKVALISYKCPSGQEIKFYAFKPALAWFLAKNGYAP